MTSQMADEQLDRELRAFLAWQSDDLAGAPTAGEMALRVGSRVKPGMGMLRPTLRLAWVAAIGLLVMALLGGALMGAFSRPPVELTDVAPPAVAPPVPARPAPAASALTAVALWPAPASPHGIGGPYEGTFLRLEVADRTPTVVVVGVGSTGTERVIARLPEAWIAYAIDSGHWLAPTGAISGGGRLAIPVATDGTRLRWQVYDLHHPGAAPIVVPDIEQDVEQIQAIPFYRSDMRPSVIWGPDERLAIPWYEGDPRAWKLTFVDGRTGAASTVNVPGDRRLMPAWAADGSGVLLGGGLTSSADPVGILRPDGTVADASGAALELACRTRDAPFQDPSRREATFSCLSPNDAMHVTDGIDGDSSSPASAPTSSLSSEITGDRFSVDGKFAGWMEVVP